MKQLITIIALLVSVNAQAQKILSHTTTIGKFDDSSIELTENTNGTSYYTVYLTTSDLNDIGKLIKTNTERVRLEFNTKEQMEKCLRFLYNFDKGKGYYIDLENKSNNMVMTLKNGFIIGALDQIDKPVISKYLIGKLLNSIGVSVKKNNDTNKKNEDDMYTNSSSLF